MAELGRTYVAGDVDTTQREFENLPAGVMLFEIDATDVVKTGPEDARTGVGLKYTANVLAPEQVAGRKFFGFINLENVNPNAQEIGQREFASLRRAVGVNEISNTEELHFRSYTVKLGMGRPSKKLNADGTPMYPAAMEVKRYFFPDEGNVPAPEIDATQPAAARPANDNRPAAARANANDNQPAQAKAAGSRPWSK